MIWLQDGFVALQYIAALEIGLQRLIDLGGFGEYEESGRVLVETMHGFGVEERLCRGFVGLAGHREEAGGFINHHQIIIFKQDLGLLNSFIL